VYDDVTHLQHKVEFVAPQSIPDAPEHETLEHVLDALDDMERWKQGILYMCMMM
jgi:hypothetical protein